MKKLFKIGCGCLIVLFVIILVVSAFIPSEKASQERHEESFQVPEDETVRWERRTANITTPGTTANAHLRSYCKENGLKEGFDAKKKVFCCVSVFEFELKCPPSDRTFIMRNAIQIRRAALTALLDNLDRFAEFIEQKPLVAEEFIEQKPLAVRETVSAVAELKLKNLVYRGRSVATQQKTDKGITGTLTTEKTLFYGSNKLLERVVDSSGEKFTMAPVSARIRGALSEADRWSMLEPFLRLLISDGLPVTFEYTAYSWDEKRKEGQVALLLVYDLKKGK